ncbi:MAG: hypothetical protein KAR40_16190 [Candidatus Sabulitectum sp.]|nr:hypothetical protein [Candidatus Sabulitectum sp.]
MVLNICNKILYLKSVKRKYSSKLVIIGSVYPTFSEKLTRVRQIQEKINQKSRHELLENGCIAETTADFKFIEKFVKELGEHSDDLVTAARKSLLGIIWGIAAVIAAAAGVLLLLG